MNKIGLMLKTKPEENEHDPPSAADSLGELHSNSYAASFIHYIKILLQVRRFLM